MRRKKVFVLLIPLILAACDDRTDEERREAMHLPPLGTKGNSAQGRIVFEQYCVACHGPGAQGSQQGPPLVHRIYRPGHHADLSFHLAVKDGVRSHHWQFGDMEPVPEVTPENAEHIIAYIRHEQRKAGIK